MNNQPINVGELMIPRWNPDFGKPTNFPVLNGQQAITPDIVNFILMVYENETPESLQKAPHNVITRADGTQWTTWDLIFFLRQRIKSAKHPILYLPNGTPLYERNPLPSHAPRAQEQTTQPPQPPHQSAE